MAINWIGFLSVGLAIAVFQVVYLWGRNFAPRGRILGLLVGIIGSLPAIWFSVYYLHVLPEPTWFYEFRSWSGSELFVVLLGVPGGFAATLIPKWACPLPLFLVIGCGAAPFLKPVFTPLAYGILLERWDGDVCQQSLSSTCGAASTATILRRFGIASSEMEVARAAYTSSSGTESWYLARFIRSKGLDAKFIEREGLDETVEFPAITGVFIGVGHFIPILEFQKTNGFTIGDPLRKREILSHSELEDRYDFTGTYLVVSKKS